MNTHVFIYEMFSCLKHQYIHVRFISWNIHTIQVHAINRPNTNGSSPNLQHQLRAGAVYFQTHIHTHLYIYTSIHPYIYINGSSSNLRHEVRAGILYISKYIYIRTHLNMYTCIHVYTWVLSEAASRQTSRCLEYNIFIFIYIHIYTSIHVYMYTYI